MSSLDAGGSFGASSGSSSSAAPAGRPPGLLRRLLSSHNPCYVISAALVFWGLRSSFDARQAVDAGWLFGSLTGYILLLAATAWVLLRVSGSLWEDVRTIVLLVLLILLALSVLLDDALVTWPRLGTWFNLAGAAFAALTSEGLLRGLRINLRPLWRVPYHAILALYFLYPIVLSEWLEQPNSAAMQWGLFLFSPCLAVILVGLVPAVRRGGAYVRDNGTPWGWPLFPWSVFVVLIGCGGLRAYYLCLSLHFVDGEGGIFDLYFLAPVALALGVLALERGLARQSPVVERWAFAFPLLAIALAGTITTVGPAHDRFLGLFRETLGITPLAGALGMVCLFAGWGALRGAHGSLPAMAGALVGLALVNRDTLQLAQMTTVRQLWGLATATAVLIVWACMRKRSFQWTVAATLGVLTTCLAGEGTWLYTYDAVLPLYLLLACGLLIGAMFDDQFSYVVRRLCAMFLGFAAFNALLSDPMFLPQVSRGAVNVYVLGTALAAWLYGWLAHRQSFAVVVVFNLLIWLLLSAGNGYQWLRPRMAGLDAVVLGLAFFVAAAMVSLNKAGRLGEFIRRAIKFITARLDFSRKAPAV